MVSRLTFLALEALLPAVVLVVVTGLLLRFAWKERRGQRVLWKYSSSFSLAC